MSVRIVHTSLHKKPICVEERSTRAEIVSEERTAWDAVELYVFYDLAPGTSIGRHSSWKERNRVLAKTFIAVVECFLCCLGGGGEVAMEEKQSANRIRVSTIGTYPEFETRVRPITSWIYQDANPP